MDELLQHFGVNKVLKEVQDNFWKQGVIKKIEPSFYTVIVGEPESIRSVDPFRTRLEFNRLPKGIDLGSASASDLKLVGSYGFELARRITTWVPKLERHIYGGSVHKGYGIDGRETYTSGGAFWEKVKGSVEGLVRQTMTVIVVSIEGQAVTYGLKYHCSEERYNVKSVFNLDYSDKIGPGSVFDLDFRGDPNKLILPDEAPDVLKRVVGDQIIYGFGR